MKSQGTEQVRIHVFRPVAKLHVQATIAALAFFAPIFAVLFWLTIPRGTWVTVVIVLGVVVLLCAAALIGAQRSTIWVSQGTASERGVLGRTRHFVLADVHEVVMLDVYRGDAVDTYPQLFVTGHDGRTVLRMRGQFWTPEDMETLADELGAPVVRISDPLTMSELNHSRPELLYWFERRPTKH